LDISNIRNIAGIMAKEDILMKHIYSKYNDLEKVMTDEHYTEEDVKDFLQFCDRQERNDRPQNVNIYSWQIFRIIVKKIKEKGIESVLMRNDVIGTHNGVEQDDRGNFIKFISVNTKYGSILVYNGRQIKGYVR